MHALLFTAIALFSAQGRADDPPNPGSSDGTPPPYQKNTLLAMGRLQHWYGTTTGLWSSTGWWNSANILTTLADYEADNEGAHAIIRRVFNVTYSQAQIHRPNVLKVLPHKFMDSPKVQNEKDHPQFYELSHALHRPSQGFYNEYYDDEGWWALAWLKVYDITKDERYLQTAIDLFEDMKGGYNATCGGIWWNKNKQANTAIANELFLAVAAQLAIRVPESASHREWAFRQWAWFNGSGMIAEDYNIIDGLDLATCKPLSGIIWTYTHGVILGALLDLGILSQDDSYVDEARSIAKAAIRYFGDDRQILHEPCEPNCGGDGPTFKGVFMRNLGRLQSVVHDDQFKQFIKKNAESIWTYARNFSTNELDLNWSGPFKTATAATQGSACDALVAAIATQDENL